MVGEESTFNDLKCRVLIPTVNLSTGKPQFFKTPHNPEFHRDGRIKLIDAALATSAAPTYFAPHYCVDLDSYFADGDWLLTIQVLLACMKSFAIWQQTFLKQRLAM